MKTLILSAPSQIIFNFVFALFSISLVGAASPPTNPPISLKEAFRSALEKTETVPIGKARIHQSEARVDQAKSRFFPALSFGASYQQQDTSGVLSRQSSSLFGGGQSYTRFTLSQSIYEGGRDLSNLNAVRFEQEVQKQNLTVANYTTFTNVARSFYAILANEKEVDNLRKTIELANERILEIKKRAKIGRSRNIELLAAEAQLSVLQAQEMAAEGQLVTAWDQFILITGLPRDVKLTQEKEIPDVPGPLEKYLADLENRPDISALRAQIESSRSTISVAKAGHLPSVGIAGNYYLTREGTQKGNTWDVGAILTLPLFVGGLIKAQVHEATERANEAELLLQQARRQGEIAIRTAYNNLIAATRQVKSLESALRSTEQNYKEQEKNYRFGQATNLDVIQALNSFQDTKRTLDKTRYLAFSAWAELSAATAQVPLADTDARPDTQKNTEGGDS